MRRAVRARRIGLNELLTEVRASLAGSRNQLWTVLGVGLVAFTAISYFAYAAAVEPERFAYAWTAGILRGLVGLIVMAALYRAILLREGSLWRIDMSTLRFAGGALFVIGIAAAFIVFARLWAGAMLSALALDPVAATTLRIAFLAVAGILVSIAFLRTQPWLAGLAIGSKELSFDQSWVRTSPMAAALVGSWAIMVLPLMVAQAVLVAIGLRVGKLGGLHLGLSIAVGLAIAGIALTTALLNATAFRLIRQK